MTTTTTVPVPERLREPLAAFLSDALKMWLEIEPLPVGRTDDRYFAGWTQWALCELKREGVIPIPDVEANGGDSYSEFVVSELLDFEARAVIGDGCPEGVEGTLQLAADLMKLAAIVEALDQTRAIPRGRCAEGLRRA